jgi:hypothetical protein
MKKRVYFIQMRSFNDHIQVILLSKLLSFAKKCMIDRLNIIVQEDKTFIHAFKHQNLVFMNVDMLRLLWSRNSFNLNMIESCWSWIKRQITRTNASRSLAAADKAWLECWQKELSQNRIQKWIERISRHVQRVIELNENNEYREDREDDEDDDDIRSYNSNDHRTRYLKNKRAFCNDDNDENDEINEIMNVNVFSDDDEWFFEDANF